MKWAIFVICQRKIMLRATVLQFPKGLPEPQKYVYIYIYINIYINIGVNLTLPTIDFRTVTL